MSNAGILLTISHQRNQDAQKDDPLRTRRPSTWAVLERTLTAAIATFRNPIRPLRAFLSNRRFTASHSAWEVLHMVETHLGLSMFLAGMYDAVGHMGTLVLRSSVRTPWVPSPVFYRCHGKLTNSLPGMCRRESFLWRTCVTA